ncbi:MAG: type III-A CRISPR-associated protein Cas10/Csm1 [Lachnospiraceae bacterium]|nr:type III-A CRISPR-associated protein Cas10/Csm1 [Lachnospiraceae bacterium]
MQEIVYASLLHGIGELFQRVNSAKIEHGDYEVYKLQEILSGKIDNEIQEAIEYHHIRKLKEQNIGDDSIAYILYEADNIAATTDKRDIDEEEKGRFNCDIGLSSVFNNVMHETSTNYKYEIESGIDNKPNMPKEITSGKILRDKYICIANNLSNALKQYDFENYSPNSLMQILKDALKFIPSSTTASQYADISLYEHIKLTAAIASCMYKYCKETNITDYKNEFFEKTKKDKNYYLLLSMDLSGVQKFIYTITSKNAGKMLKARSFYLDFLMEHCIDELLEKLELTRANVIYSGGAHSYLLLPNTNEAKEVINFASAKINNWLIEKYNNELFLNIAYEESSASNFDNTVDTKVKRNTIFRKLAEKLGEKKLHKYDKSQLEKLLTPSNVEETRECIICKASNKTIYNEEFETEICVSCNDIYNLGKRLQENVNTANRGINIIINNQTGIELPSLSEEKCFAKIQKEDIKELKDGEKRIYGINKKVGNIISNNINMGLYGLENSSFEEYSEKSIGVKKFGVLRADVDNLGNLFKNGLKPRLSTLSRYTELSNKLSEFFKENTNYICSNENFQQNKYVLSSKEIKGNVKIIYSGGDDLFIVGAWDEIIELAVILDNMLKEFSTGKVKLSAGVGMFYSKFPISKMASIVGELEDFSKEADGKNCITLFEAKEENRFDFEGFKNVFNYIKLIEDNFDIKTEEDDKIEMTSGTLNNLLKLINNLDKINIVRTAYLLGRLEEKIPKTDEIRQNRFKMVKEKIYNSVHSKEEAKALRMALIILIYKNREEKKDGQ